MSKTKIEWVKNPDGTQGYTINPVKGLCPMACSYCYARAMYKRFKWNPEVSWYPPAWDLVDTLKKPSRIFVGSTFELFHDSLPYNWMEYNLLTAKKYPQHTLIFLTKQPQNLLAWSPFPPNCYVGVTATNTAMLWEARKVLPVIKARIKFISFEPLLEEIESPVLRYLSVIANWVILGAQTKPYKPPKIEWVQEIARAAEKAKVPVFLKDNLMPIMGGYPIPKDNMWAYRFEQGAFNLRQEMPGLDKP